MVQVKVLRTSPELMERDVNQFLQSLAHNPQYNFKIIDTNYSTPTNGDWNAIVTYTMTPKQRALAPVRMSHPNPLIGSEP